MTKKKIVVIGGGWAGCAAALTAEKAGADVTLLERTDMLLGTGLVGGIFRNNGRYTAAEECIAMGAGDLFTVMEAVATHKNMDFPGHKHATLYNIYKIEPAVKKLLLSRGIKLLMADPAVKTEYEGDTITAVITKSGLRLTADAFVDVSSTAINTATAAPCVSCAATASAPASASLPSPAWKNGQQKSLPVSAP